VTAMIVDRIEDMSPEGFLRITIQTDMDAIIEIGEWDEQRNAVVRTRSVEFCAGPGGGSSPATLKALHQLAVAMAEDNAREEGRYARGRNKWSGSELLQK